MPEPALNCAVLCFYYSGFTSRVPEILLSTAESGLILNCAIWFQEDFEQQCMKQAKTAMTLGGRFRGRSADSKKRTA